jgi:uncharacterized protein (DUF608 family)
MSKYLDEIRHKIADKFYLPKIRRVEIAPELTVTSEIFSYERTCSRKVYYRVVWEKEFTITDKLTGEELLECEKIAVNILKDQIYGEFRTKLFELQYAVYEENTEEALKRIKELFEEIS